MALINSIKSLTLDLPPSCIAFSPLHPQLFVVGTYHLHGKEQQGDLSAENQQHPEDTSTLSDDDDNTAAPAPQKRTGSLILFHLGDDNTITLLSTTATEFAVLDIQWSGNVLAVATSTGLLAFYRLDACDPSDEHVKELKLACEKRVSESSTLVLSLAWHPTRANVLGLTLSDGRVVLCSSTSDIWNVDAVVQVSDVHAHTLEAWTLAFSEEQILSGGDDIQLQCTHIQESDEPQPLWQDRKLHQAGITAILPLSSTLVITGSYDDHIRLLSLPPIGRKSCLTELNLGGGVWRLKALSSISTSPSPITILASCMHAGTRIVHLIRDESENVWRFEVLARFEEHRSMNYGSDVQPEGEGGRRKRVVSTSFYDRLLCLWES